MAIWAPWDGFVGVFAAEGFGVSAFKAMAAFTAMKEGHGPWMFGYVIELFGKVWAHGDALSFSDRAEDHTAVAFDEVADAAFTFGLFTFPVIAPGFPERFVVIAAFGVILDFLVSERPSEQEAA